MKLKLSFLLALVFSFPIFAQVGINTENPQGIFNIDGQKNNPTTGTPSAVQQVDDFVVLSDGKTGIGTTIPQNKLEINSGVTDKSGLRLTNLKNSTATEIGQSIGVDANGDVVNVNTVGTVFIGRVLPGSSVGTGYQFLPLEPVFDPENKYNASTYQWVTPNSDKSIYQVDVTLHRIDGTMPFSIFRPNSANLVNLPTTTGQYFNFHYSGISSRNTATTKLQGAGYFGIFMLNNSGSNYTFDPGLLYVDRGYWTITIKRIGFVN